jgi:uncharacterized membrane protein YkgB
MRTKAMSMPNEEMAPKMRLRKTVKGEESMTMVAKDDAMRPSMEITHKQETKKESTMTAQNTSDMAGTIDTVGRYVTRYALVLVLGWIGFLKFQGYEAEAIQPLVANSPLLGWLYNLFSVQALSNLIGFTEIVAAILIAIRPLSGKISAIGSAIAVATFATTISFLFSTPAQAVYVQDLGGFPYLSGIPGQLLVKDFILLGAAIWTLADALRNRA